MVIRFMLVYNAMLKENLNQFQKLQKSEIQRGVN